MLSDSKIVPSSKDKKNGGYLRLLCIYFIKIMAHLKNKPAIFEIFMFTNYTSFNVYHNIFQHFTKEQS